MMSYRGRAASVAQLAKELGTTHVLEGSVRREGQALRVTLHLVDGRADNRLWSHSYDRQLVTATTLQSEIAADVAARLPVKFASTSPSFEASSNPDSYDAYLKALLAYRNQAPGVTREHMQSVIDQLDVAIERDPDFAAAHLLRAQVHLRMFTIAYDNSEERLRMARRDIDRAKALAGETPRYLAVEGIYALTTERDLSRAISLFDAARPVTQTDGSFMSARASLLMRLRAWTNRSRCGARTLRATLRTTAHTSIYCLASTQRDEPPMHFGPSSSSVSASRSSQRGS